MRKLFAKKLNKAVVLLIALTFAFGTMPITALAADMQAVASGLTLTVGGPSDKIRGEFVVEIWRDGSYQTLKTIEANQFQQDHVIPLDGAQNPRIRISKRAEGMALLDAVLLDGVAPTAVGGGAAHAHRKLAKKDLDVLEISENGIVLDYRGAGGSLILTGRIEPKVPDGFPFVFDAEMGAGGKAVMASAPYNMSNTGKIEIDDIPDVLETADAFRVYDTYPTSGHPDSKAWIWVKNDSEYLYVATEWGSDNTFDHGEDFFKVFVDTGSEVREYIQWSDRGEYGKPMFAYTGLLPYQHMCYELKIPLAELGNPENVKLGFSLYGTSSAGIELNGGSDYDFTNSGAVEYGYTAVTPLSVTVENTDSSAPTGDLTVMLSDGDISSFTLVGTSISSIATGGTVPNAFTVAPITDLPVRTPVNTYKATVKVYNGGVSSEFDVSFTVTEKSLTLKADDKTIYIGDPEPAYTYTVDGLVGSDTAAAVITTPPSLSVANFDSSAATTFTIDISGGDTTNPNYTIDTSYIDGTLTVSAPTPPTGGSSPSKSSGSSNNTPKPPSGQVTPLNDKPSGTANDALKKAAGEDTGKNGLNVKLRNVSDLTRQNVAEIMKKAKALGVKAMVSSDTMGEDDEYVEVRVTVDPELITDKVRLDGYIRDSQTRSVKNTFLKFYKNKISVIRLGQQGEYGQPAKVAAKTNLTDFDTDNLYFYAYDREAHRYVRIANPSYKIDSKGYLHFITDSGDYIIVSDGPLTKAR